MIRVAAAQAAGLAVVLAILYWWTGLPEGTGVQVAVSAFALLAALGVLAWFGAWGVRALREIRPLTGMARLWFVLYFLVALRTAYWLIWWVPEVQGFGAQMASMVTRFGLAYFVVVIGWSGLLWVIASGTPRSSQASTAGNP